MKIIPILLLCLAFSGCIRVAGTAGYYKQDSDDLSPKAKQVGFDTQNVVNKFKTPGSVEFAE